MTVRDHTAALLHGTPEGDVVCDGCNTGMAEYRTFREQPVTHGKEVYVFVTQGADADRWFLRWLNCPNCGPVGSGESTDSDEFHAKATLAYDSTLEQFVLDEATPLTEAEQ